MVIWATANSPSSILILLDEVEVGNIFSVGVDTSTADSAAGDFYDFIIHFAPSLIVYFNCFHFILWASFEVNCIDSSFTPYALGISHIQLISHFQIVGVQQSIIFPCLQIS